MDWFVNFSTRALWRVAYLNGYLVARYRRSALLSIFAIAAEVYLHCYKNRSYIRSRNGEDRVAGLLGLKEGDVVFDVGAHHGDYARYLKAAHPQATVHCFELSPGNIKAFRSNAENEKSGLELHEFGLGASAGEFEIFESKAESMIVSLHPFSAGAHRSTGQVRRGDQFCAAAGIDRIAFLKVDTEGNDLEVLRGFGDMLVPGRIDCIQFEYNETSIAARVLLNDFFQLLEPAGYILGKIYPLAVEFGPYSIHLEDHRANNYCAVSKGSALEQRLAGQRYWGRGLR